MTAPARQSQRRRLLAPKGASSPSSFTFQLIPRRRQRVARPQLRRGALAEHMAPLLNQEGWRGRRVVSRRCNAYAVLPPLCRRLMNLAPRFVIDRYSIAARVVRALPALGLQTIVDFVNPSANLLLLTYSVINILVKRQQGRETGRGPTACGKTVSHAVMLGRLHPASESAPARILAARLRANPLCPAKGSSAPGAPIKSAGLRWGARIKQAAGRNGLAAVMRNRDLAVGEMAYRWKYRLELEGWRCGNGDGNGIGGRGAARDLLHGATNFPSPCSRT